MKAVKSFSKLAADHLDNFSLALIKAKSKYVFSNFPLEVSFNGKS
jgi:hypothetical protein